jgi:hypothetical protein
VVTVSVFRNWLPPCYRAVEQEVMQAQSYKSMASMGSSGVDVSDNLASGVASKCENLILCGGRGGRPGLRGYW